MDHHVGNIHVGKRPVHRLFIIADMTFYRFQYLRVFQYDLPDKGILFFIENVFIQDRNQMIRQVFVKFKVIVQIDSKIFGDVFNKSSGEELYRHNILVSRSAFLEVKLPDLFV